MPQSDSLHHKQSKPKTHGHNTWKEDVLYKKSPKRYHNNLKTAAGLQPRAKDQPNLTTVRGPITNEITSNPQTIIDTIQTHYEHEHARTTPDTISAPPWRNPNNPDPYDTKRKDPDKTQDSLNYHLTPGHYTMAYQRASTGKAPRPDTIPNEIIKFLPETAHDTIYTLYQMMAMHSYTPKK